MSKITAERELETMPFDKVFYIGNGRQELCHVTGIEVQDEDGIWWNEYQDSDGDYWYGR
jgi:hypothetical protein